MTTTAASVAEDAPSLSGRSVVLVINSLARGGAETQFLRLAGALTRAGAVVRIVTLLEDNDFRAELAELAIEVHQLRPVPGRQGLSAVAQLWRLLRTVRPELVVSFLYQASVVSRIAARAARVPVVVSSMRNEQFGGRARDQVLRLTDGLADLTVLNSELAAAAIIRRGVVPASKLVVVPNGLDVDALATPAGDREQVRAELGIGADEVLFLGVGRLNEQKAWPDLISAAANMAVPSARWCVAGDGPLRDELQRAIDRSGLSGRFRLLGPRGDVPALLHAADALVLSSHYEGLPNVVLEAMAAGLPVVATEVGGVPELVGDQSGFLCPAGDVPALARAMRQVVELLPDQRRRLGAAGRTAVSRYRLSAVEQRWTALLADQLAGQPAGRSAARRARGVRR